jgi:hypothetical protein
MRRESSREQTFVPGLAIETIKTEINYDDDDVFSDVLADVALSKEEQLQLLYAKSSNFYIKNLVFSFSL